MNTGATQQTCYIPTAPLTFKTYADNRRVDYSYTTDGKLASRIWARGVTNSYDCNDAGDFGFINVLSAPLTGAAPEWIAFACDRVVRVRSGATPPPLARPVRPRVLRLESGRAGATSPPIARPAGVRLSG